VYRLTREVRFSLHDPDLPIGGGNGFAGVPAITGLSPWLVLRVTLGGPLNSQSSYLRNIKDIDDKVRQLAISLLAQQRHSPLARLPSLLYDALLHAWPGTTVDALSLCLSPYTRVSCLAPELPMVRLSHQFEFSAAHRLHNPALDETANRSLFGKCNNPLGHGHNYVVEVSIRGQPDVQSGQLIALPALESLVNRHAINALDHKHLNLEVPEFAELNPSVEHIAMVIHRRLKQPLQDQGVELASVTVWETPKTWCEYSE
jgi:6-pyruvoyltetrahydropterin/6-carboxytetrahydropterin synthase